MVLRLTLVRCTEREAIQRALPVREWIDTLAAPEIRVSNHVCAHLTARTDCRARTDCCWHFITASTIIFYLTNDEREAACCRGSVQRADLCRFEFLSALLLK